MVKGEVEISLTLTCDTCKEELTECIVKDINDDIDVDWEIELLGNDEGWEVDDDDVICYECAMIRDTAEENEEDEEDID